MVAACTIHGTGPAVGCTSDMGAVAGEDDSCLQTENSAGIAAFERKVGNLLRSESVTERGILSVDHGSGAADFHGHAPARNLHGDVHRGGSRHLEFDSALFQGREASGFDGEIILRGRQFEKLVVSLIITLGRAAESGCRVRDGHGRMGK